MVDTDRLMAVEGIKYRWNDKIKELKKSKLDKYQRIRIMNIFKMELATHDLFNKKENKLSATELIELMNDLQIALEIAQSNHLEFMRKTSWWYKLSSSIKNIGVKFSQH